MAVVKPPVMPATPEAAWVNFNVPVETLPPEVLLAVAVNDAKTDELTRAVPPRAAAATMAIFAVKVLADSNFFTLILLLLVDDVSFRLTALPFQTLLYPDPFGIR